MTPFEGTNTVTSPFGPRIHPITGAAGHHNGQDIVASGPWPGPAWQVRACAGGTVTQAATGYNGGRGSFVAVQTAPATAMLYFHLHEIYVQEGQPVAAGAPLGMAGSTGASTGVHLHFEVRQNGAAVNPAPHSGVPNTQGAHPGAGGAATPPKGANPMPKLRIYNGNGGITKGRPFTKYTEAQLLQGLKNGTLVLYKDGNMLLCFESRSAGEMAPGGEAAVFRAMVARMRPGDLLGGGAP